MLAHRFSATINTHPSTLNFFDQHRGKRAVSPLVRCPAQLVNHESTRIGVVAAAVSAANPLTSQPPISPTRHVAVERRWKRSEGERVTSSGHAEETVGRDKTKTEALGRR